VLTSLKIRSDRAERTHLEATAQVEAQRKAREEKTARLQALRLAKEAAEQPPSKPKSSKTAPAAEQSE